MTTLDTSAYCDAYKNAEASHETALLTIDRDQLEQLLDYVMNSLVTARHAQITPNHTAHEWETLAEGLRIWWLLAIADRNECRT